MTKKRTDQLLIAAETVASFAAQKPFAKLGV